MARARLFYFGFLGAAIVLFGCASWLPSGANDVGSMRGLIRFLLLRGLFMPERRCPVGNMVAVRRKSNVARLAR
jgi:hypothetical protein